MLINNLRTYIRQILMKNIAATGDFRFRDARRNMIYRMLAFGIVFAAIGTYFLITSFASNPNLPGDENNDGSVNTLDMSVVLSNWQASNASVDLNGDGNVNILDLSILL